MPPTTRSRGAALTLSPPISGETTTRSSVVPSASVNHLGCSPAHQNTLTVPAYSTSTPLTGYRIPKKKPSDNPTSDPSSRKDDDVIFVENVIGPGASGHGTSQVFRMAHTFSPPPNGPMRYPLPAILNAGIRNPFPTKLPLPGIPSPRGAPAQVQPGLRPIRAKPPTPTPSVPPSVTLPSTPLASLDTVDLYLSNPVESNTPAGAGRSSVVKLSLRSTGAKTWKVVNTVAVPVNTVGSSPKKPAMVRFSSPAQSSVPRQRFKSVTTPKRRPSAAIKTEASAKSPTAKRRRVAAVTASSSGTSTDADSSMSGSTVDSRRADSEASSNRSPSPAPTPVPASVGLGPHFTVAQKAALTDHYADDEGAAERYTTLKEWTIFEASKLFGSGEIRAQLRSMVSDQLDTIVGDNLTINDIDTIKNAVETRSSELNLVEFKRQLCQQIIRLRDPNCSVYHELLGADNSDAQSDR